MIRRMLRAWRRWRWNRMKPEERAEALRLLRQVAVGDDDAFTRDAAATALAAIEEDPS